jgi:hypothetical protein
LSLSYLGEVLQGDWLKVVAVSVVDEADLVVVVEQRVAQLGLNPLTHLNHHTGQLRLNH